MSNEHQEQQDVWADFDAAYKKACETSDPKNYQHAALIAQQVRMKVRAITQPPPTPASVPVVEREAHEALADVMAEILGEPDRDMQQRPERYRKARAAYEASCAALSSSPAPVQPIDMVLFCPSCGKQHVDKPEGQFYPGHTATESVQVNQAAGLWQNPPHRSHLCHSCGTVWRPADVPTNGVEHTKTKGKADTWVGKAPFAAPVQGEQDKPDKFADDPELTVQAFANRLAEFMKRGSLSAKDVNEITGVSESTLSRLKNHGRMPDAISYAALCNMMGWHPHLKHKMAAGRVRAARSTGGQS